MAAVATRRKLLSFARSTPTIFLNLNQNPNFLYILSSSHPHFSTSSEDCFGDDKFKKWQNGGDIFHESACIDSTAFLDVGAIVYSQSIVASNVRIGSGTLVGPSVSIAHSTQIGILPSMEAEKCAEALMWEASNRRFDPVGVLTVFTKQ
ncbi:hypothetical protein P8452_59479 [Trifolium repens]|nr:hypothetical protein P8452_59479 [Trifolium repens]